MRRGWQIIGTVMMAVALIGPMAVQAASGYASPMIEANWQQAERVQPNFWGPLATARDGQMEAYKEAPGGKRTVQYFDKARMEQFDPNARVTTGLLTVELKSGKVQLGDGTFETRSPAQINMAGDPGGNGLTYADLAKLNEKYDNAPTTPSAWVYGSDRTFHALTNDEGRQYAAQFDALSGDTFVYQQDPSGRFGQFVYAPFVDFINRLTAASIPVEQTPGYAISPVMVAQVSIGGKATTVFVQAFERRVLTYNPNNPAAFRVEFGNIGQHYYGWRYGG